MWLTNKKTGKKFNTDWIDSDNKIKEKYIHINPNYKEDSSFLDKAGFNNNCVKCAIAFEANMRGEDVQANEFKFGNSEDIEKSKSVQLAFNQRDPWDIGRPKKEQVAQEIELMMKEDFGKGSRAIIQEQGKNKHTMNVVNFNDRVIIVDAQSGKHGGVQEMLKGIDTKRMILFRTDTQDISPDFKQWAYRKRKGN